MAWGSDANTEEELEKLAAVRGYFEQQFPGTSIRDSYDADRIAQVFRIQTDGDGPRDAVVSTSVRLASFTASDSAASSCTT